MDTLETTTTCTLLLYDMYDSRVLFAGEATAVLEGTMHDPAFCLFVCIYPKDLLAMAVKQIMIFGLISSSAETCQELSPGL